MGGGVGGDGAESREGGGGGREPENKNEVCDSVRKSDNKTISWGEEEQSRDADRLGAPQKPTVSPR